MKKTELNDLKKKSPQELAKTIQELKKELTNLFLEQSTGKLKDLHKIRIKKRSIARVLTLFRLKSLETGKSAEANNNKEVKHGKK